jgi:hypothetical protein
LPYLSAFLDPLDSGQALLREYDHTGWCTVGSQYYGSSSRTNPTRKRSRHHNFCTDCSDQEGVGGYPFGPKDFGIKLLFQRAVDIRFSGRPISLLQVAKEILDRGLFHIALYSSALHIFLLLFTSSPSAHTGWNEGASKDSPVFVTIYVDLHG